MNNENNKCVKCGKPGTFDSDRNAFYCQEHFGFAGHHDIFRCGICGAIAGTCFCHRHRYSEDNMISRQVDLSTTFIYVIDESLKMSKGKIAAQISHIAMQLADKYNCLGRAIILKADHETFKELATLDDVVYIKDAGLTEVPLGTMTCIGFKQTDELKKITKSLKLV